jgi:hypothetical protein
MTVSSVKGGGATDQRCVMRRRRLGKVRKADAGGVLIRDQRRRREGKVMLEEKKPVGRKEETERE